MLFCWYTTTGTMFVNTIVSIKCEARDLGFSANHVDSQYSSLISDLYSRSEYTERCVMNNYFGIGLDAKITLDFQNKRDEHPEKCRYVNFNMKVKLEEIFRRFSDITSRFIVNLLTCTVYSEIFALFLFSLLSPSFSTGKF